MQTHDDAVLVSLAWLKSHFNLEVHLNQVKLFQRKRREKVHKPHHSKE